MTYVGAARLAMIGMTSLAGIAMAIIPLTPASGEASGWDPRYREYCGSSTYASNIEIYSHMYVDCRMAKKVAKNRALGRKLPGFAGSGTSRWDCTRSPDTYAKKAFGRRTPPGYVDCVGYRGVEFIRFAPRRRA